MNDSILQYSTQVLSHIGIKNFHTIEIGQWHGYKIMILANTLFFSIMHVFINYLDDRIENQSTELTADEKIVKPILLNFILGASIFNFNTTLSKMIQYPLSPLICATITIYSIGIHLIFNLAKAYHSMIKSH